MLVLSRHDVEGLLSVPAMLDALEAGFLAYSTGRASVPPRTAARAPSGLLGAMPGWVAERGLALKAVTVFPGNGERRLPTHQGVITLFDEQDGSLLSVMDGEHITAMRTGGGAAVSVRALARSDAKTLTILGAGVQGHSHLATVPQVRDFTSIRICSRDPDRAAALAAADPRCTVLSGFEQAIRGADVVCCCTDAREPITRYDWFDAGTACHLGGRDVRARGRCGHGPPRPRVRRVEGCRRERAAGRCSRVAGTGRGNDHGGW